MNIGIIQFRWPPVMAYTVSIAEAFARKGHSVHYFVLTAPESENCADIAHISDLAVYKWYPPEHTFFLFCFRAVRKIAWLLTGKRGLWLALEQRVLYRWALKRCRAWLERNCPGLDVFIGIEKGGLLCASYLHDVKNIPYFYYSLELYTRDHPFFDFDAAVPLMQQYESAAHANSLGTIIQDPQRADALYADTGVSQDATPAVYFPVTFAVQGNSNLSIAGLRVREVCAAKKRLINFGNHRLKPEQLAAIARNLPHDYTLFMHNLTVADIKNMIAAFSLTKVELSEGMLDEAEIMAMIAQARIGLCWYDAGITNNRLTAFASEKLARYLFCGLPVIANAATNFCEFFSRYECGVAINTMEDVSAAINSIEISYEKYSSNAVRAFNEVYAFQPNFARLEAEVVSRVSRWKFYKAKNTLNSL
jgi:hypothetical protein